MGTRRLTLLRHGKAQSIDSCAEDFERALTRRGTIEGTEIICPRHGARFCLRTGEALTPPAYEPVRVYEIKIEGDHLWVRAD